MARARVGSSVLLACSLALAACGGEGQDAAASGPSSTVVIAGTTEAPTSTGSVAAEAVPVPPPAAAAVPAPAPVPVPTTAAPAASTVASTATTLPRVRRVGQSGWSPFATVGGVTLTHPAARVERVGFHEASHDGARQMEPALTAVAAVTVESRQRGTGSRTAADIVVHPADQIRSPVTGRVKRAGGYILYCKHQDDYVVVEPDARPGWEVKILHIDNERVSPGDRLTAGRTVIADRATQLPFESQVDELRTADPAWPHVHVEVVDLSIPDRPTPGGGCP